MTAIGEKIGVSALLIIAVILVAATIKVGMPIVENLPVVKADIKVLKAYLRALPAPNECPPPGSSDPRICLYAMKIDSYDNNTKLFVGTVDSTVVADGKTACEKTKSDIVAMNLATVAEMDAYPCLDPDPKASKNPYHYIEYGLEIVVGTHTPQDLVTKVVELESIANKTSLKLLKIR